VTAGPAPEAVAAEGLAIRYPYAAEDAVGPLSLSLAQGERVLLLGPSGCGKSTLLHALTGLLPRSIPADRRGTMRLFGEDVDSRSPAEWAARVAFLFQDADQTLAGFTVEDEIAFALENRAHPPATMRAAVAAAMAQAGLPGDWGQRRIATLSGGQKQIVALAATLAQGSDLVIADEPTASLAAGAARLLAERILAPGRTALIVDHRLGPLLERIDRVIVLSARGRLLVEGTPEEVFARHGARLHSKGIWTPPAVRLRLALEAHGHALPPLWRIPDLLAHLPPGIDLATLLLPTPATPGHEVVRLDRAACAPPFGPVVLRDITLGLRRGEVLGILGPNGAGKSTLGACLAGLAPPRAGRREGPPGAIAFQNPEAHFTTDSPRAELADIGLAPERIAAVLEEWGLSAQADQHPYSLSMGQKRRLALALLTATDRWPVLVLDEPTAGLDRRGAERVADHIRALARTGRALAVITHDADFALSVCDRIALLADGGVARDGPATQVLRDTELLRRAGLAPPEVAPLLDRMDRVAC
jgi:energy-coupling factor transport system ATP-binding protein